MFMYLKHNLNHILSPLKTKKPKNIHSSIVNLLHQGNWMVTVLLLVQV